MQTYTAVQIPATPGSTYQLAMYTGDAPAVSPVVEAGAHDDVVRLEWVADSDVSAAEEATRAMAGWPGWVGSLNRLYQDEGLLLGRVWLGDIRDCGRRVDRETDGFDRAVSAVRS